MSHSNREVINKIAALYADLFNHDGFGEMSISMKLLKRNQKEVLIKCGCEYRFIIDYDPTNNGQLNFNKHGVGAGSNVIVKKQCNRHASEREHACKPEQGKVQ